MSFDSVKKARIIGFSGSWGSGIAHLSVETKKGLISIPCDNGPTARSLNAAFPGFIGNGHLVGNEHVEGRYIAYVMDDMGLVLGGFAVISELCWECGPFKPGCDDCDDKEP